MKELIQYFLQFGKLKEEEINTILSNVTTLNVSKNGHFSEIGKIHHKVAFIFEGILRVYYHDEKGEEITKYFVEANNLVVDIESFNNLTPSDGSIQAMTDCKFIVFSREDWQRLLVEIEQWNIMVNKMISHALLQKIKRRSPLVAEDATTRYLKFLEIYPNIINQIPLSYVASYLGVTQSSLSRIRKNIN
ncbi:MULTISPECIES: Crp/Fnr family transcriptional regulator [unclassified Chryseobacterium]|uniref:Crp/Fnr family transcriptional regulator n=1 Tax=unclassified Chryseobacterium TaxID=2593645 RepID=UPI00226A6074|nr:MULTISPECIES: Crp/Fnr family transcriptional regulator [unclassified Chryseobacterium]